MRSSTSFARSCAAFTLIELLSVVSIIVLMTGLAVPAFNAMKGGSDLATTAYDIQGILDGARAYAMTNNTYVYVGIQEFDASRSSSVVPQVSGTGRVAIAVLASKDGTRGYSLANPGPPSNLVAISSLQHFENTHLLNLWIANSSPAGPMSRPNPIPGGYVIGTAAAQSSTTLNWPMGSNAPQYQFQQVIYFDPAGAAGLQTASSGSAIPSYIEVGLEPAHGTSIVTSSNFAAIQVDGETGSTHIFRP